MSSPAAQAQKRAGTAPLHPGKMLCVECEVTYPGAEHEHLLFSPPLTIFLSSHKPDISHWVSRTPHSGVSRHNPRRLHQVCPGPHRYSLLRLLQEELPPPLTPRPVTPSSTSFTSKFQLKSTPPYHRRSHAHYSGPSHRPRKSPTSGSGPLHFPSTDFSELKCKHAHLAQHSSGASDGNRNKLAPIPYLVHRHCSSITG